MSRKQILKYEILFPLIWFCALVIWKYFVRHLPFQEVIIDASFLTLLVYFIFNIIVYFRYEAISEKEMDEKE